MYCRAHKAATLTAIQRTVSYDGGNENFHERAVKTASHSEKYGFKIVGMLGHQSSQEDCPILPWSDRAYVELVHILQWI